MRVLFLTCVIGAAASPALAGDWRSYDSVWSQRDVPGDYRCDAYWDRGRTDCHERWRDQRHLTTTGHHRYAGAGWRQPYGYAHAPRYGQGYGYAQAPRYGQGYGYGQTYAYAHAQAYGQGYAQARAHGYGNPPAQAFHGAYGRPDLVYGGGGYAPPPTVGAGRDPGRIAWCGRTYRSYDPRSGYYRAYSGRLVWCG